MSEFFVVCLAKELEPDFIFGKLYKAFEDEHTEESGLIRVFNEFDEDYLYPQSRFKVIEVPEEVKEALIA